jgi:hypothetical protein
MEAFLNDTLQKRFAPEGVVILNASLPLGQMSQMKDQWRSSCSKHEPPTKGLTHKVTTVNIRHGKNAAGSLIRVVRPRDRPARSASAIGEHPTCKEVILVISICNYSQLW